LPSRYSIDNATYNAAPHHVYTFQVGTEQSCLLKSSFTDGKQYIPEVTKYTGTTVVQGSTLSPGGEHTYQVDKDGVMKEIFDEGNPTWTGSEEKEEVNESTSPRYFCFLILPDLIEHIGHRLLEDQSLVVPLYTVEDV
jgi:hypothetical protein